MLTGLRAWCTRVLTCVAYSRAYALVSLASLLVLCLYVLTYLICLLFSNILRACAWYPRLTDVWQGSKCASKGPFKKYLIKQESGKFTKKVMKNDTGWVCSQKIFAALFLATQFSLLRISLIGSNNITVRNNKHPKDYLFLWDSYILSHPKHHSSTIFWKWLVNTCASMCKHECTDRL